MPDLFAPLPASAMSKLSEVEGYKAWRICTSCYVSHIQMPLRACSGCIRPENDPIYYCSRKCQKDHWRIHKMVCDRQTDPSRRINGNYVIDEVKRTLSRWSDVHSTILLWSLENIYHYNAHLDPHKTTVHFYLKPKTMRLWSILVQSRDVLIHKPEVRRQPGYYFYSVSIPSYGKGTRFNHGATVLHSNVYNTLDTPASRARITGHPQWLFLAASLTETYQPSTMIANKKLSILTLAIEGQCTGGWVSFGPEFKAPSFVLGELVEIEEEALNKWYTKLTSVDLWAPLLGSRHGESKTIFSSVLDQIDDSIRTHVAALDTAQDSKTLTRKMSEFSGVE